MSWKVLKHFIFFSFVIVTGCSQVTDSIRPDYVGKHMWLRTNLRAMENKVTWDGYLSGRILPAGKRVKILEVNDQLVVFLLEGRRYYFHYGQAGSTLAAGELLAKFFESEPPQALRELEPRSRGLIALGEVEVGMTKDEVLLSWGYPHRIREEPTIDKSDGQIILADDWVYRESAFGEVALVFSGGRVAKIVR
ncbi:MAG: hypothetical protein AMS15_00385 [Planctomycetes bacterium DG_23]|nr:MAG: hypothetical protein AMS15_00385 [Planctomycetes bacterium DG_23]